MLVSLFTYSSTLKMNVTSSGTSVDYTAEETTLRDYGCEILMSYIATNWINSFLIKTWHLRVWENRKGKFGFFRTANLKVNANWIHNLFLILDGLCNGPNSSFALSYIIIKLNFLYCYTFL
jgi:hypothetical protein